MKAAWSEVVCQRVALLAVACGLSGLLSAYQQRPARWPAHSATGSALAARGCLDGRTASAEQWRSIPGIGKKVAQALAAHCPSAGCDAAHPPQGIRGVGPVLAARIGPLLCPARPEDSAPIGGAAARLAGPSP